MPISALTPVYQGDSEVAGDLFVDGGTFQGEAANVLGNTVPFVDGYDILLGIECTDAGGCTVTVNSIRASDQGVDHNASQAIGQDDIYLMGPYSKGRWKDTSDNLNISYSAVTGVKVLAMYIPVGGI